MQNRKRSSRIYKRDFRKKWIYEYKRKSSISEILKICKKYGYEITNECILTDNVLLIAHDYEE